MNMAVCLLSWLRMMTCLEDSVLMKFKVEIWDKKQFKQFGTLEFETFNLRVLWIGFSLFLQP